MVQDRWELRFRIGGNYILNLFFLDYEGKSCARQEEIGIKSGEDYLLICDLFDFEGKTTM